MILVIIVFLLLIVWIMFDGERRMMDNIHNNLIRNKKLWGEEMNKENKFLESLKETNSFFISSFIYFIIVVVLAFFILSIPALIIYVSLIELE